MTDHLQQLAEELGDTGAKYKCQDHLFSNVFSDIQKLQRRLAAANKELTERRRISGADAELSDHDRAEVERCRKEVAEEAYAELKKKVESNPLRLKETGENDFILDDGGVWIEIDNIVAYVRRVEDGVAVDLTPTVSPHETLDCCCADFGMAKEFECTKCGEYNNDGEGFNGLCSSCSDKAESTLKVETHANDEDLARGVMHVEISNKSEETEPQCGHPKSAIVSGDEEGPSYCEMCEKGEP